MSASNLPNHVFLEVVRILDLWGANMWRAHARSFMRCWRPTQASATIGSTIACFLSLPTTASSSIRACTPGMLARRRLVSVCGSEPSHGVGSKRRRRTSVGGSASTCSQRDCVHVGSARRMACARSPHGADKKHSVDLLRGLSPLGLSLPIVVGFPTCTFYQFGMLSSTALELTVEGHAAMSRRVRLGFRAPRHRALRTAVSADERVAEQDQTHGLKQHENVEKIDACRCLRSSDCCVNTALV